MGSQQNNNDKRTRTYDKYQQNLLAAVMRFDDTTLSLDDDFIYIRSITFKAPTEERSGWLSVTRADLEGVPSVGFHNGDTFGEVLKGTIDRLQNRSMKWKEDQYAKPGSD